MYCNVNVNYTRATVNTHHANWIPKDQNLLTQCNFEDKFGITVPAVECFTRKRWNLFLIKIPTLFLNKLGCRPRDF